jgi:hypothetical protein
MKARLKEYRRHCVTAEQKAQEDFDKSVLTLSGGGLGISFAFIKDLLGPGPIVHPGLLFTAWVAWGISIISTLASFFFSQIALRTAIRQVDDGTIGGQYPGRAYARVTVGLNALGGIMFLVGVGFIVWFVALNLGGLHGAQASPGR